MRLFRWLISSLALAFLLLIIAMAGSVYFLQVELKKEGPLPQEVTLVIKPGQSVGTIAQNLNEAKVITSPLAFRTAARLKNVATRLQAGEYVFPAGVPLQNVIDILTSGKKVLRKLTIAEGLTSHQIITLLNGIDGLEGSVETSPPDGSLLPETYYFSLGDSRHEILQRMQDAMKKAVAELWENRTPGIPIASPVEALTLASIVEKETGVAGERSLVASVFANRLKKGMPLQSDPTVIYALSEGKGKIDRALLRKDWKIDHPYNTYKNPGLPPGPIANPGRASIEAVLNPAESDYLYFVADGTGGHAFATTLREHNNNVRKWRRIRDQ